MRETESVPPTNINSKHINHEIIFVLGSCDRASRAKFDEGGEPTRCNNYVLFNQLLSQHVSGIIMPIFRRTKTVLLHREQSVKRENKPTRCNNQIFIINFCLNMFRASLCPSSGEQRPCYCAGSAGCGW